MADEVWDISERERAAAMGRALRTTRAREPVFAVRAPGRVNLIGEHTDYSGLPVLPVAIDRSTIVVAAASADARVFLRNSDASYAAREFVLESKIPAFAQGDWGNYFKAAVQGVIDHFGPRGVGVGRLRGARMYIDSRVPVAAGLSSSAALTVASALAFMAVNSLELPAIETAAMVASAERYVGTESGGMDQAASLLGRRNHALFIEFDPLRVRHVGVPGEVALVVADSGEKADKSGKVRTEYNRRVVECREAASVLAREIKVENVRVLGDVIRQVENRAFRELIVTLRRSLERKDSVVARKESRIVTGTESSAPIGGAIDPGVVLKRARHVLSETERVIQATRALEEGRLDEMGHLMNESHRSLRDDFECSTERLDRMVEIARRAGALGARLTGAGFGGSIVALCRAGDAERVIAELDREYYGGIGMDPESARAVLHASHGAAVIQL